MKLKLTIVSCVHETKYGADHYVKVVKKNENPRDIIAKIEKDCEYDEESDNESFDFEIQKIIIDADDFETINKEE